METARFSGWFQFESEEEAADAVRAFPGSEGYQASLVQADDLRLEGDRVEIEVEKEADEKAWDATIDAVVEFATPSIDGGFDAVHSTDDGDMVVTLTFDDDLEDDDDTDEHEHDHADHTGHDHGADEADGGEQRPHDHH